LIDNTSDSTIDTQRTLGRRAKIVCTIGPATDTEAAMRELIRAGMNVARLNFSHGSHDEHRQRIQRLRRAAAREGRSICILQDLQGPKIRTGMLEGGKPVNLVAGSRVIVTTRNVLGTASLLSTTFEPLPREVQRGSMILLSDGRLSLRVLKVKDQDITCEVVDGGLLGEKQGINLPGAAVSVPSLTPKDYKDLRFGIEHGVDIIAVSFVRTARDVLEVKRAIAACGGVVPVIAKLEKPQAIDNLESILKVAEGVMVARGDLGVEVPPEKVPVIQKHVIRRAMEYRRPVITATQMLESMIQNPRPTRAEVSDVANAVFDGSDAVMLSGETATGKYPREAVAMMASIICEAEQHMMKANVHQRRRELARLTVSDAICESAAHMAEEMNMRAIAVYTETGNTARSISKYRPRVEVYAFTQFPAVQNRMNLLWGVHPELTRPRQSVENMVRTAETWLRKNDIVKDDDVIAIVAGTQRLTGSTDFIRLHRIKPAEAESKSAKGGKQRSKAQSNRK
jgi:pyruvate kinase